VGRLARSANYFCFHSNGVTRRTNNYVTCLNKLISCEWKLRSRW